MSLKNMSFKAKSFTPNTEVILTESVWEEVAGFLRDSCKYCNDNEHCFENRSWGTCGLKKLAEKHFGFKGVKGK